MCLISTASRELHTLRSRLSKPLPDPIRNRIRQIDFDLVNYLLSLEDVWARVYAQWVATSSQDSILLQQLEALRQDAKYSDFYVQWSDADFGRLSRETNLLFIRKGWLR
jgi:hypothetical protein